jgi:hypothetical protein
MSAIEVRGAYGGITLWRRKFAAFIGKKALI